MRRSERDEPLVTPDTGHADGSRREAPRRARRALPDTPSTGSPADLDRVIHERLRLAMASALAVDEVLTFVELKTRLQTTDGNLSVHARKLEEAGYVTATKGFDGRMPRTEYRLTHAGRKALERYLDHMERIIRDARGAPSRGA
jgi:DNA-binding transcriptional ArsR family regulator